MSLKRTALYEEHRKLGARLIDFGGWELPVQYSGVMQEHEACRQAAGLFDVSHMGEVLVEGPGAEKYLNYLVTNNVAKLRVGQAQYTVMCHESGGIVDDLVIYRRAADRFLVVVNASNTEKDFQHFLTVLKIFEKSEKNALVKVTNESSRYSQIAVQGRKSPAIVSKITSADLSGVKTYWFVETTVLGSIPGIIARTGYTGEDGFEIYVPWEKGPEVWRALLEVGEPLGMEPCGLGARDTLRMEMKYPLYGNELNDKILPIEAGLSWVVKMDKGDFLGRAAILEAQQKGISRQLVGLKLLEKGIPRHGYALFNAQGSEKIGEVTSGTQSPSLKEAIGIGYVPVSLSQVGSRLSVEIRGTKIPAEVVAGTFYKKPY